MKIDYPRPEQLSSLQRLWETAFGDGAEFLDIFYGIAYAPDRCRCITMDGTVAAALYWFETFCRDQRFAYIYGVATDPVFRNRGLCAALMEDAKRILAEQGYDGAILYPATPALSRMYEKMGFRHCTCVREFRCEASGESLPLKQIDIDEFARLRRELLPPDSVIQEGADLRLLAALADFYAGDGWIAALTREDGILHCHEILGKTSNAPEILRALNCEQGCFRTCGSEKPFSMYFPLTKNCVKPGYFGLPLD